jgi:endo-1,4-beta-xylanase
MGALSTGPNWWNGIKRIDVGFGSTRGMISVNYFTGGSPNAVAALYPAPEGSADALNVEVARIADQIVIFVNGQSLANLPDPGLFASGQVYLGFNVAPQNQLTVLALAATMPSGSNSSVRYSQVPVSKRTGVGLRDLSSPLGPLIGAAITPAYLNEPKYAEVAGSEFGLVVPENAMKWGATEYAAHQFDFCQGDQVTAFAEANGMKVRGHTLVWGQGIPDWVINGAYSSAESASVLQEHIDVLMGHYKGRLIAWDVVNEAVSDSPPYGLKQTYWLTKLGSSYVDTAFQWARAADPGARLFYNDYSGEGLGGKSDAIYRLVQSMLSRGIPIDGVGLQMHLDLKSAPSQADISANIARLGALGLEVHITEMDVRLPVDSTGNASAADQNAQAEIYRSVMSACRANANCTAFLTWGVSDAHSWIPSTFPWTGAALLFDSQYQQKPDYGALEDVLQSTSAFPRPTVNTDGIVIHGAAAPLVSPGSLVDIYGTNLASQSITAADSPLPVQLATTRVFVDGISCPLLYVSPAQIVFQMPYSATPGLVLVQIDNNGLRSTPESLSVQLAAPSILVYGNNRAVVQNEDSSTNSLANCALPGSYIVAYLTGSGPLENPIATGLPAPSSPLSHETLTTTATVGGVAATVSFAGMTPGFIGLMQVNIQTPNDVSGDVPLQIAIGGALSNKPSICMAARKT